MKILYPLFAVGLTLNAYWTKRIHGSMGMSFMRLLSVTDNKTDELKNVFVAFDPIRWNALSGCLLALVVVIGVVKSKAYSLWVRLAIGILWCLVLLLCLSPD
jgi:hypothetical protein